jgi:hypothetical protein
MKLKLILYLGICLLYSWQPVWAEDVFPNESIIEEVEPIDEPPIFIEPEPAVQELINRELRLHQTSFPEDIFVFPPEWENGEIFVQRMPYDEEKNKRTGVVDFRIEGIRSDIDMDVYVAFSTRPIVDWQYQQGVALDYASLEIIAGARLLARPVEHFLNVPTSFTTGGFVYTPPNVLVFAVNLEDFLNAPQFYSDEIYFQAIAVPAGSRNFEASDVQSSEVDFYRILR